jgi:hypothetical protein
MSATVDIIIDEIPEAMWVPIEAVFNRDSASIVYSKKGRKWRAVEVELGVRNSNSVIINSNFSAGKKVALIDMSLDKDVISSQPRQSLDKKKENGSKTGPKRSGRKRRRRG